MKKFILHLGYWLIYLCQAVLLIFLLNINRYRQPFSIAFSRSLENNLITLIPKILLTYYIFTFIFGRNGNSSTLIQRIVHVMIVLFAALLIYRALAYYWITPVIYGLKDEAAPFWDTLSFLISIMDVGFAVGTACTIKQYRLNIQAKENEKHLIKDKLESELKFLRNQINPHFLFNTLNNIYGLARKKSDNTAEVVMKLSKILRFMLYETSKQSIKISEEMKMLDDYIELEKIRYSQRLSVYFVKQIDDESQDISPLLLLNFVENAFKHGTSESKGPAFIKIHLELSNNLLTFEIENTKGNQELLNKSGKIGLENVKRRLELLYKEHEIKVVNEQGIFKVYLKVNLKSHAKI